MWKTIIATKQTEMKFKIILSIIEILNKYYLEIYIKKFKIYYIELHMNRMSDYILLYMWYIKLCFTWSK